MNEQESIFIEETLYMRKRKDFNRLRLRITQKYFPGRDLLQLHKCAQRQQPSGEGHSRQGAV